MLQPQVINEVPVVRQQDRLLWCIEFLRKLPRCFMVCDFKVVMQQDLTSNIYFLNKSQNLRGKNSPEVKSIFLWDWEFLGMHATIFTNGIIFLEVKCSFHH